MRIMCEDLTLYRGESGTPYLIGGALRASLHRAAHRLGRGRPNPLHVPRLALRRHGPLHRDAGRKTRQPERSSIAGYPVHEYCRLALRLPGAGAGAGVRAAAQARARGSEPGALHPLAGMGLQLLQQPRTRSTRPTSASCTCGGRSSRFGEEIDGRAARALVRRDERRHPADRDRSATNIRVSDWTFPNNNHIVAPRPRKGDPWSDNATWHVPIDDEHTMRFAVTAAPGRRDRQAAAPPRRHHTGRFLLRQAHRRTPHSGGVGPGKRSRRKTTSRCAVRA